MCRRLRHGAQSVLSWPVGGQEKANPKAQSVPSHVAERCRFMQIRWADLFQHLTLRVYRQRRLRKTGTKVTRVIKSGIAKVVARRHHALPTTVRRRSRVDVTVIPSDQLKRLLASDAPDAAPGLTAMAARRHSRVSAAH